MRSKGWIRCEARAIPETGSPLWRSSVVVLVRDIEGLFQQVFVGVVSQWWKREHRCLRSRRLFFFSAGLEKYICPFNTKSKPQWLLF